MHETSHQAFNRLSLALLLAILFAVVAIANADRGVTPEEAPSSTVVTAQ